MAQSIHDHAIDVRSDVLRVAVPRVPRETDDSEAPRQPFLRPHLGPLKRAALRVRIDYGDVPSPVRPEAGGGGRPPPPFPPPRRRRQTGASPAPTPTLPHPATRP